MFISKTLKFYKRDDIQEAMAEAAEYREVAIRYGDRGFGRRPDILQYKSDILEHAKKGATSFHCSEELWSNPLNIETNMKPRELDEIRKGWDLILDIDCEFLEYSKVAAHYTVEVLKHYGVKSITCKFSGNKGFHIAVPFEAFPKKISNQDLSGLFPEAPRKIAAYIKYLIKNPVSKKILEMENNSFEKIVEITGKTPSEIIRKEKNQYGDTVTKLDAEPFLNIDTILIAPRHLFRMPYSFHEKSQLVSIPIDPETIMGFEKPMAEPEKVKPTHSFLNRDVEPGEAGTLLIQALDHELPQEEELKKEKKIYELPEQAIPEEYFPPSIKKGLEGLKDGRKRFLFILLNFLGTSGWNYPKVEERVLEWNEENPESLREAYVRGQLRYFKQKNKILPPPNYETGIYRDLGLADSEEVMKKYKNPVVYAKVMHEKSQQKNKKKKKKKKKS